MDDLKDRVIMVTGPAGNLGKAVADQLLEAGSRLILVDRSEDRLPSLFPDLTDSPDHFLATATDVSDLGGVEAMVSEALERFEGIDGLVNTVGSFGAASPLEEACLDHWDRMMQVNAYTTLVTCKAVIPNMVQRGRGNVVNTGSRLALKATARTTAYAAAKAAVLRITEALSDEVKRHGVNVNCVLPGTLDTPENRKASPDADYSRWTPPASVADVILFLLSQPAGCVHGAAVPVYGLS